VPPGYTNPQHAGAYIRGSQAPQAFTAVKPRTVLVVVDPVHRLGPRPFRRRPYTAAGAGMGGLRMDVDSLANPEASAAARRYMATVKHTLVSSA